MPKFPVHVRDPVECPRRCANISLDQLALTNSTEGVGMTYRADLDCDHQKGLEFPVLEVHRVLFDHQHYKNPYGNLPYSS